jgi:predicted lipoprotein with Yx(FWY)xxD motif
VRRTTYAFALLAVAAAFAIAGCGGSSNDESPTVPAPGGNAYGGGGKSASEKSNASSNTSGAGGPVVISLASAQKLGMILVDSKGFTVYDFHKDKGSTSSCYGPCAQSWPPVLTEGEPEVGNGASASMLGTTKRKDGTMQVTYAGHPLYTFVEDKKPGEANGNDISLYGGEWYALKGNGEEPED